MAFTFLTAEWRKLIMAQYRVDPAVLAPHLPAGLELDFYRGENGEREPACYVSLVGFLFDRVRILGVPVPFHTRFEEVNLRFYVRRSVPPASGSAAGNSWRRGVVFLSEIVPKPAISFVARTLYGEAYSTGKTRHDFRADTPESFAGSERARRGEKPELQVGYAWSHKRQWNSMRVDADNEPHEMTPGSMEQFITEHYWGYTRRRGKSPASLESTQEYAVEHDAWQVYPIKATQIQADFGALYGDAFAHLSTQTPDHVLLAEGAPVSIRWGSNLAAQARAHG